MSKISQKAIDLHAFSRDASHYLLIPDSVARPTNLNDISNLLRVRNNLGAPLTFRSGGTSLSGQSISDALLVDTRIGFKTCEIFDQGKRVKVAPGVTIREVNNRLKPYGYRLGPDPASEIACTIGGVIANNSSGMLCGTETNAYATIDSLKIVFADGSIFDTAGVQADSELQRIQPNLYEELRKIKNEIESSATLKSSILKHYKLKNTMGYGLNSFTDYENIVDILLHLIIGSEGTLAFIAEATFNTVPIKPYVASSILIFPTLKNSNEALNSIIDSGAAAIELLDKTSLKVAKRDNQSLGILDKLTITSHAGLIIEYQEDTKTALDERIESAERLISSMNVADHLALTSELKTRNEMWHIRKGLYASVAGERRPGTTALLEDIAVPVSELAETCESLITLFDKYKYEDSVIFGHARDGNIHFMLNEDFNNPNSIEHYQHFTEDMVDLVLSKNGTLKAEHGTGRVMAPFVKRQYGDQLYNLMLRVKNAFDPKNILNPDVIITHDPKLHLKNFKTTTEIHPTVNNCVECGFCEPGCPSKNLTLTPRQRIAINRSLNTVSKRTAKEISKDYQYQVLDTCAADSICSLYCPLKIDTGELVRNQRANNSPIWSAFSKRYDLALAGIRGAFQIATKTPLVNLLFRKFWNLQNFQVGSARRAIYSAAPEVVYLPSCISEFIGPPMQQTVVELFQKAGINLLIPEGINQICCGTPWKSKGHKKYQKPSFKYAIPVITDNSSCTNAFEALDINKYVLENVLPKLTIKKVSKIVIHPTCSSEKANGNQYLIELAKQMADEVVIPPNWNCCGFAGDRGFIKPELTASATLDESAFVKEIEADFYVSTNKGCETALSNATNKPYKNILEVLRQISI